MEFAKIKINIYKKENSFHYNDKKLIGKTNFKDYESLSVLDWADEIIERFGREIYDDYHLTVCGDLFSVLFLKDISISHSDKSSDYECLSFKEEVPVLDTPSRKRLDLLLELANKYKSAMTPFRKITVSGDINLTDINQETAVRIERTDESNAEVLIQSKLSNDEKTYLTTNARIIIVPGKDNKAYFNGRNAQSQKQYIWSVADNRIKDIMTALIEHFSIGEQVYSIAAELVKCFEDMDVNDQNLLQQSISIDTVCCVGEISSIKNGSSLTPDISYIPNANDLDPCRIESSDSSVVSVENGVLFAHKNGDVVLEFYVTYDGETKCIAKRTVHVVSSYIERIILSTNQLSVRVGEQEKISVDIFPNDAVDTRIQYSCSSPSMITITPNPDATFSVLGTAVGNCTISFKPVSGTAEAVLSVSVLSTIEKEVDHTDCYKKGILSFSGYLVFSLAFFIFKSPYILAIGSGALSAYYMLKGIATKSFNDEKQKNAVLVLGCILAIFFLVTFF